MVVLAAICALSHEYQSQVRGEHVPHYRVSRPAHQSRIVIDKSPIEGGEQVRPDEPGVEIGWSGLLGQPRLHLFGDLLAREADEDCVILGLYAGSVEAKDAVQRPK